MPRAVVPDALKNPVVKVFPLRLMYPAESVTVCVAATVMASWSTQPEVPPPVLLKVTGHESVLPLLVIVEDGDVPAKVQVLAPAV